MKEKKDKKFMKPGKTNDKDRINFVKFWANYIKTHKDEEWSKQQNLLINSQIRLKPNPPTPTQPSSEG